MNRWRGLTALVTGASAGIGRQIAIDLLNHGLNVVACARRVDAVESIRDAVDSSAAGQLMAVKCDVSKEEEVLAMFAQVKASKWGGVDVLVNNAGLGFMDKLSEGKTSDWAAMLNVNVLGLSICTREALKSMRERGVDDGHVVHISSLGAHRIDHRLKISFYKATKWAVRALTEGLRQELAAEKSGIRVTSVSPGLVKTEFELVASSSEEISDQTYRDNNFMLPSDVSAAVLHALTAPKHVQTHDVIIRPVGQPQE